jgi:signal peptidase
MARTALPLLRRLAGALALVVALAFAGAMLVPAVLGYERYVIVSGSMSGTVDTGSIVYAKPVPTDALERGDVITYAPPAGASPTELVTHRVASITRGPQGERIFRTKGDANRTVDPWTFTLPGETQATMRFHVPYVGYAISALSVREVRMAVIGGPALLIALLTLVGLARDTRAASRARRAPSHADVAAPVVTGL